jgi:hypothetical protein
MRNVRNTLKHACSRRVLCSCGLFWYVVRFGSRLVMRNENWTRSERAAVLDAPSMAAHNRPRFTRKLSSVPADGSRSLEHTLMKTSRLSVASCVSLATTSTVFAIRGTPSELRGVSVILPSEIADADRISATGRNRRGRTRKESAFRRSLAFLLTDAGVSLRATPFSWAFGRRGAYAGAP